MFYETVYTDTGLGDALNPGGAPVWEQLGFGSKALWKQAGRPTTNATVGTPFVQPSGVPIDGITGAGSAPAASGGIGDMLGSIPPMYLMIGAVIVLLMVLKK